MIEPKAIRHNTKANKMTKISEYNSIRKYVPQRVKHHLTQCPALEAKRKYLNQSTGTKQQCIQDNYFISRVLSPRQVEVMSIFNGSSSSIFIPLIYPAVF